MGTPNKVTPMTEAIIQELIKTPLSHLISSISGEFKQEFRNRILEYETSEYRRNYYSKTILHRVTPKSLMEFYQPLYIKRGKASDEKRISTKSPKKLFNQWNYITIIGTAGSGKSTIVKYLFTECIKSSYKIPIKVELRYLNDADESLADYIFNTIFKFNHLGFTESIIVRLLQKGNFVFFFDGFDEVNSNLKSKTLKDIDDFVNRFNQNFYLITSRPYTSIDLLPNFENFEVCKLNQNEISAFIKKQIPDSEQEIIDKIIKAVNSPENRSYSSFLSNPLLLSMFILTFQTYSDIPPNRSDFYRQVFDTLFSVHDSISKLAYSRERLSDLTKNQTIKILSLFSFISFFEETYLFSSNYLYEKLDIIKSKKTKLNFDNDNFINDLQIAISILNKDGIDYTFPHRSLQEYFAACYIESLSESNKKNIYNKLLNDIIKDNTVLINRDHFYMLLSEIDFVSLTKYLTVPVLRNIHKEVKELKRISKRRAYKYTIILYLIFSTLLNSDKDFKPFYGEVVNEPPVIIYIGENEFLTPRNKDIPFEKEMNLDLIRKNVKNFKEKGDKYIVSILSSIENIDKSDEEILNLI